MSGIIMDPVQVHRAVWQALLPADGGELLATGAPLSLVLTLFPVWMAGMEPGHEPIVLQANLADVLGAHIVAADAVVKIFDELFMEAVRLYKLDTDSLFDDMLPWDAPLRYLSHSELAVRLAGLPVEAPVNWDDMPQFSQLFEVQAVHRALAGWLLCQDPELIGGVDGARMAVWGRLWLGLLADLKTMSPVKV